MATSGTITGTVTGNSLIKSKITWTETSYSTEKNTSNVTVKLIYYRTDNQTTYGTGSWVLNINGTKYTGSSYKEISHSEVEVFSKAVTITHDSNGAKTFSMNASGSKIPGTSLEGTNCSGTGTLTTIPRASSFNSITSSVALGGTATIKITAKSENFYHKFTFKCGSVTAEYKPGRVATTSAKTYSYTIPTGWAGQIANSTSKTVSVTMQTCSNEACTTNVGSAVTKNFTVTVPNSGAYLPSVSLATSLENATSIANTYVQGKTSVTLSASSGKAGTGASIKSYTFKRESTVLKTVTTTNATASTSETTNTAGSSVKYSVTITDSRGRTATTEKTITVYEYTQPLLTVSQCYRSSQDGTKNVTSGTYINVLATFSCSSVNNKNAITTRTVQYKEASESSYSGSATNLTTDVASILGNGAIEKNKSYTVLVTVTDTVGTTVTKTITIPTIFVTMDFKAGGTGVAFGKIADTDGLLDVGMDMQVTSPNGTYAKLEMLADGYKNRGIVYSTAGNFGFRERDNNTTTWLLRFAPSYYAYMHLSLCLGEDGNTLSHDYYLKNNKRTVSMTLNADGSCGMYHSGTGWILKADTNNNITIPNGTFSAPKSIIRGSVHIDPTAANTPTGVAVGGSWGLGGTPTLLVTPYTGVPGTQVTGVGFSAISKDGATIVATRTNTSGFTVHYLAIYN